MPFRDDSVALRARLEALEADLRALRADAVAQRAEILARIHRAIELIEAAPPRPADSQAPPESQSPAEPRPGAAEAAVALREAATRVSESPSVDGDTPPIAPDTPRTVPLRWKAVTIAVAAGAVAWLCFAKWGPKPVPDHLAGARLGMTRDELGAALPAATPAADANASAAVLLDDQPARCHFEFAVDDRLSQIQCLVPPMPTQPETDVVIEAFVRRGEQAMGWPDASEDTEHGSWRHVQRVWKGNARHYRISTYTDGVTVSIELATHRATVTRREADREAAYRRENEAAARRAREEERLRLVTDGGK